MAGLILDEDIALVRERASLPDVVTEAGIALRSAGGGRFKGLCPFHDEKSPSFNINPVLGYYMCFGCGESGDVISFVRKHEQLSFVDAIERLARRYNVELRRAEDAPDGSTGQERARAASERSRLLDMHRAAQTFFAARLADPGADAARRFLAERGFDQATAAAWGVGYAPDSWDALIKHLQGLGFTPAELVTGGVASEGKRGLMDRFRNRLAWPIRDISGDTIGFGCRKLSTDPADDSPKYLNSPETPLYKKSTVLYGLDVARKDIAKSRRVVVVEGYTDVMACHAAGVTVAVATCGTAFGAEHISMIRRVLLDQDGLTGEIVFTFDGDAAGQKAALKAFGDDQKFAAQTYIAVSPGGMDPCELRLDQGDRAVAEMIEGRLPLVEFAIRSVLSEYDLRTAEGAVHALDRVAPFVAAIKDKTLRPVYARKVAGWLGVDSAIVDRQVAAAFGRATPAAARREPDIAAEGKAARTERELCRLAVQAPASVAALDDVADGMFASPLLRDVCDLLSRAGGLRSAGDGGEAWVRHLLATASDDPGMQETVGALAVEGTLAFRENDPAYGPRLVEAVHVAALEDRLAVLHAEMQRMEPGTEAEPDNMARWAALLQVERELRERRARS